MSVGSWKNLFGKGKDAVSQNADKIQSAIDKAAIAADSKTNRKYSGQIRKVADAAKKAIPPKK
ncbi:MULTISPECIES: antitoxin [Rhodococcus]|uniref:Antitoxin n=2 Tax=Rhodococcus TaxID=1827 RepID=A0A076F1C2_RHOOP|nr:MULTISPECIES: antitoxin [Rhodococcus]AII11202.1 hypothetical protein EP51_44980 [Rhodococcus opacus]QSE87619.1 antitoxin [Rhodococcus pseudokoreensis]